MSDKFQPAAPGIVRSATATSDERVPENQQVQASGGIEFTEEQVRAALALLDRIERAMLRIEARVENIEAGIRRTERRP